MRTKTGILSERAQHFVRKNGDPYWIRTNDLQLRRHQKYEVAQGIFSHFRRLFAHWRDWRISLCQKIGEGAR
jgi:hypothetical protein